MGRIEYKYLVSDSKLEAVRNALLPYLQPDRYAARRPEYTYIVRSLYFDTSGLSFYVEKLEGLYQRKKLRARGYNEYAADAAIFLEIKYKTGPIIRKTRARVRLDQLDDLLSGGEPFGDQKSPELDQFLYFYKGLNLLPTILITYDREAYFCPIHPDLRITFDKNIRSRLPVSGGELFTEQQMLPALPGHFILEVKTSRPFPRWLHQVISDFEFRNEALSKYVICLDTHFEQKTDRRTIRFPMKLPKPTAIPEENVEVA